jgi:hypothetical protein
VNALGPRAAPRAATRRTGQAPPRTGSRGPVHSRAACSQSPAARLGEVTARAGASRGAAARQRPPRSQAPPRARTSSPARLHARPANPAASTPRREPAERGTRNRGSPDPSTAAAASSRHVQKPGVPCRARTLPRLINRLIRFTGETPQRVSSSSLVAGRRELAGSGATGRRASRPRKIGMRARSLGGWLRCSRLLRVPTL